MRKDHNKKTDNRKPSDKTFKKNSPSKGKPGGFSKPSKPKPFKRSSSQDDEQKPFSKSRGDKPFKRENSREDRPFKREDSRGDKPYKKPFSRENSSEDSSKSYHDRPFKRDNSRDNSRSDRPFNRDDSRNDRPYKKPFNRENSSEDSSKSHHDRPYKRDNSRSDRPYKREDSRNDRPYKKPFNRENSSEDSSKSHHDRPFKRDDSRSDRPFKREDSKRRSGGNFSNSNGDRPYKRRNPEDNEKRTPRAPGERPFAGRRHDFPEPTKKRYDKNKKVDDRNAPIRLNKFLADAGICSRREADTYIEAGVVTVNGKPVTELGTKVLRTDVVKFNDQTLRAEKLVYVLINKPKDTITTVKDTHDRITVMDIIGKAVKEKVFPVGRLDRHTTGVLLMTNDGELAAKLTHPTYKKKKIYQASLDKPVTRDHLQQLVDGIQLEDGLMSFDVASYPDQNDKTEVGIELHSGKNRVVRRMFEALDYKVEKLDRVYFAGLTKKGLQRGRWRHLTDNEVAILKQGSYV